MKCLKHKATTKHDYLYQVPNVYNKGIKNGFYMNPLTILRKCKPCVSSSYKAMLFPF